MSLVDVRNAYFLDEGMIYCWLRDHEGSLNVFVGWKEAKRMMIMMQKMRMRKGEQRVMREMMKKMMKRKRMSAPLPSLLILFQIRKEAKKMMIMMKKNRRMRKREQRMMMKRKRMSAPKPCLRKEAKRMMRKRRRRKGEQREMMKRKRVMLEMGVETENGADLADLHENHLLGELMTRVPGQTFCVLF